jgi:glutamine synthetase
MPQVIEEKIKELEAEGVKRVKIALTDIDGVLRGKYLSLHKFKSITKATGGFCDCVFGWDCEDQLYDNATFTGWHTAFPDAQFKIDLASERRIPGEEDTPFYLVDFLDKDEKSHAICPRSLLLRVLKLAETMGFGATYAFEYEFFVFKETAHSIREKNYQNLTPLSPGMFGYSILRNGWLSDLFSEFMEYFQELNIEIEGLHCETGPGVWEAAIQYDTGIAAADKANLFKTFAKTFFQKKEMTATFMAKWSMEYPGQSGHMHLSLYDIKTGKPVFFDAEKPCSMSETMNQYIAGIIKYMKPFLVMSAPTINSYTRLTKGAWAPTSATWGVDNRTTAVRAIPGNENSQRLEFRVGAADGNPYLVAAAVIGAGLKGIEEKLSLMDSIHGNAYEIQDTLPKEIQFPSNLRDATRIFSESKEARELFGNEFVDHYVSTREWEVREYEKHVTDWQLKRYFEII